MGETPASAGTIANGWHAPAAHDPPRQSCPQRPQFRGLCVVSPHGEAAASDPSLAEPSTGAPSSRAPSTGDTSIGDPSSVASGAAPSLPSPPRVPSSATVASSPPPASDDAAPPPPSTPT